MTLAVQQHYDGPYAVHNHYYTPRGSLYRPYAYPNPKPPKRTWSMYSYPNVTHRQPIVNAVAPIVTAAPSQHAPGPIVINNCVCALSPATGADVPVPPGPVASSPRTANINERAKPDEPSASPDVLRAAAPAGTHQAAPIAAPASGVRARDVLPTIRPARGRRVDTPPPSPPPRRSTQRTPAPAATPLPTPKADSSSLRGRTTPSPYLYPNADNSWPGALGFDAQTNGVHAHNFWSAAQPASKHLKSPLPKPSPQHPSWSPGSPHYINATYLYTPRH